MKTIGTPYISCTVESEVESSICYFYEEVLDLLVWLQSRSGIDEISCTKFLGPRFFPWVGVDGDDATSADLDCSVDNPKSNCATSKNSN